MSATCSKCGGDSTVVDSRHRPRAIRRRRQCTYCRFRWTTIEMTEGDLFLSHSTKRFAQFQKDLNELIETFIHEAQT